MRRRRGNHHAFRLAVESGGLTPWPKLTGGKGIHVMADLDRRFTHDQAHSYARRLVSALAQCYPEQYILSAQTDRRGRIFLDYLRNGQRQD